MSMLCQVPAPGEPELDPSVELTHAETFDFADLRFIKSSRMSKRWLVFSLRIKVGLSWAQRCRLAHIWTQK